MSDKQEMIALLNVIENTLNDDNYYSLKWAIEQLRELIYKIKE